jgi:hypothetical protein
MTDIKPISELNVPSLIVKQRMLMHDAIHKDWYFEGVWQKLIIVFCFLYTAVSGLIFLWRFLF